jgi:dTDP-4-dehydrorhamnose 3,5-epimerase
MKITRLAIPDVISIEPKIFNGDRGYFYESYNSKKFSETVGRKILFVLDGESYRKKAELHGLHYQVVRPQGKLVRVTEGEIFDVAVDIRRSSSTFGKWIGERLSSENKKQLWIPEGFAHGFLVMSDFAHVQYKMTEFCYPNYERCVIFNDKQIAIDWPVVPLEFPIALAPELSEKDKNGTKLDKAELYD